MVSIIKIVCVAIVYFAVVSVCDLQKVSEATSELREQVKEYIVDSCTAMVPKSTKIIFLLSTNVKDYLPFKK